MSKKSVADRVSAELKAERTRGEAPEGEERMPDPSTDVVGAVIEEIGRSDD
jgi:hypothetical protein